MKHTKPMPPLLPLLSTRDVAERHGVTCGAVARWCRIGAIWPVIRLTGGWAIEPIYYLDLPDGRPGRPRIHPPKVPSGRGPGRPKGSKNRKPYPKGVKRVHKKKAANPSR